MSAHGPAPMLFGTELRRLRVEAGLSLADLSARVHYSKSHLSKVETGGKPPSIDLARQCDAALSADGALTRLVPSPRGPLQAPSADAEDGEVWLVGMTESGDSRFHAVSRRALLGGAVGGAVLWQLASSAPAPIDRQMPEPLGPPTIAGYRAMFDEMRRMGQWTDPDTMVPGLVGLLHGLRAQIPSLPAAHRTPALTLAARFAEHIGWLCQERGDDPGALWWTERSVELARSADEQTMTAYALVRRALVTMYRHDAAETIDLAVAAQATTSDFRVLGLAAQREAQGHALAGDYGASMRALDRAAVLLDRAGPTTGPELGSTTVADVVAMTRGWCLYDLGRPAEAARALTAELARVAPSALRARARYGARLALAHAAAGEPEIAAAIIGPVLDAYPRVRSATVRDDLRTLSRMMNRWGRVPSIQAARLRVGEVLYATGTR